MISVQVKRGPGYHAGARMAGGGAEYITMSVHKTSYEAERGRRKVWALLPWPLGSHILPSKPQRQCFVLYGFSNKGTKPC